MNADTESGSSNTGKHNNPGNPGEQKCRAKVITENEVERYLEAGWEIAAPVGNGKIAVKKILNSNKMGNNSK